MLALLSADGEICVRDEVLGTKLIINKILGLQPNIDFC